MPSQRAAVKLVHTLRVHWLANILPARVFLFALLLSPGQHIGLSTSSCEYSISHLLIIRYRCLPINDFLFEVNNSRSILPLNQRFETDEWSMFMIITFRQLKSSCEWVTLVHVIECSSHSSHVRFVRNRCLAIVDVMKLLMLNVKTPSHS